MYRELLGKLNGKKVDLIVSRMEGGLLSIGDNLLLWATAVKRWYSMLNKNGLMFVQFDTADSRYPVKNAPLIKTWIQFIRREYPQLKIEGNERSFKIHKMPEAPEELPFLDSSEIVR